MILLSTINARFTHASLGLRYLKANMQELGAYTSILEFTLQQDVEDMLEAILAQSPKIVGFGVYIWNIEQTTQLVKLLKTLRPDIIVVLGGPEVSYEYDDEEIVQWADFLITGWGDVSFPELCRQLYQGKRPIQKVIMGVQPPLSSISLPYQEYTASDIAHRTVYVEASRGCPFKCEFCLSSLDKTAWSFPLDAFMQSMDELYQRGLRQFKFVDRTFNLKQEFTSTILIFFLEKIKQAPEDPLFLHFELVPDYLSDSLKALILQFPPGSLQFEIGIQTLNPQTQHLISRKTNLQKAKDNITWLHEHSHVHMHVDLIAGLPGETISQFAQGFNELYSWGPHEIQLGILKRLKGTPITRHTAEFGYKYSPLAPYSVMENNQIGFEPMNDIKRLAKFWDTIANSGRFSHSLPMILGNTPFESMQSLSHFLYQKAGKTYGLSLDKLFVWLYEYLLERGECPEKVRTCLADDFKKTGIKGWPRFLGAVPSDWQPVKVKSSQVLPKRQQRHEP